MDILTIYYIDVYLGGKFDVAPAESSDGTLRIVTDAPYNGSSTVKARSSMIKDVVELYGKSPVHHFDEAHL